VVHGVNVHIFVIILNQAVIHLSEHIVHNVTFLDQTFHPPKVTLRVGNKPFHKFVETNLFFTCTGIPERVTDVFRWSKFHDGV
jgi:hypothetical protein